MRIRIKFTKNDTVKYLGHLDIMRTFQRCFNRAGIRMTYSEGFNPHQKMSFAQPLGVGVTSNGEYLDAVIADGQDVVEVCRNLQNVTGSGFDILDVRELEEDAQKGMAAVCYGKYSIRFRKSSVPDPDIYLARPTIILQKKTKTGVREVDVKASVISMKKTGQCLEILMQAQGEQTIKPELILQDMMLFQNYPCDRDEFEIRREELYARNMIPLIEYQTKEHTNP